MTKILIIDACKASVVMTSEIFKDNISGVMTTIVASGSEGLKALKEVVYDMIVVDFDLPDTDGVTLAGIIKNSYTGPVLITAYPEAIVDQAINDELFGYRDIASWVKKPVRQADFSEKIEEFLLQKKRLKKRFFSDIEATVIGQGEGRGKKAPKVEGNVINIGMGGALFTFTDKVALKKGDKITLAMGAVLSKPEKGKRNKKPVVERQLNSRVRATITWTNKTKKQIGVKFEDVSEIHKKNLEDLMRSLPEI